MSFDGSLSKHEREQILSEFEATPTENWFDCEEVSDLEVGWCKWYLVVVGGVSKKTF